MSPAEKMREAAAAYIDSRAEVWRRAMRWELERECYDTAIAIRDLPLPKDKKHERPGNVRVALAWMRGMDKESAKWANSIDSELTRLESALVAKGE